MPCITGSGIISGQRLDKNLKYHNGCIVIDIDYKENNHIKERDFFQLKEKVFSDINEICYAGLSVSGKGYYLIIRVENPIRHKEYFKYLSDWFKHALEIKIDDSGINLSRLRIYSLDKKPYINENATILSESILNKTRKSNNTYTRLLKKNNLNELVDKIVASRISIAPTYDEYFKLAVVFFNEQGEQGRHLFKRVCSLDSNYNSKHCDYLFDEVSKRGYTECKTGTLIHFMKRHNVI